jgi:hypothetical protein
VDLFGGLFADDIEMAGRFAALGGFTIGPSLQHRIVPAVSFSRIEDEFKKIK